MPLEVFETGENRAWALWRITETEEELKELLTHREEAPSLLSHIQKRLEWLAGRLLTQTLLENFDESYRGTQKDLFGKPFLIDSDIHISFSHSYPFVAVVVDRKSVVGIDLEQPKEKLRRVAQRVFSQAEASDAGDDLIKLCVYWCAKETLIKIHGKKDLVLASDLRIDAFTRSSEGNIIGRIVVNNHESVIPLYYRVFEQFVVVYNCEKHT